MPSSAAMWVKFLLLFLLQRPACGWVEHNRGRGGQRQNKIRLLAFCFPLVHPSRHLQAGGLPYAGRWGPICGPVGFHMRACIIFRKWRQKKPDSLPLERRPGLDDKALCRWQPAEQESLISNVVYYNFRMQDDLHSDLTPRHNLMLEACHTIFLFERIIMHHDTPSQVVIMYKHVTKGLRPLRPWGRIMILEEQLFAPLYFCKNKQKLLCLKIFNGLSSLKAWFFLIYV